MPPRAPRSFGHEWRKTVGLYNVGVPGLSVVVVVYNIPREAPRTLFSLSAADYQRGIDRDEYEIIVVDNAASTG